MRANHSALDQSAAFQSVTRRAHLGAWSAGAVAMLLPWARMATAAGAAPPQMLAKAYQKGLPLDEFLVSEKFDGVRGYWDGQRLLTRAGNPIAAPAWFTAGLPTTPLDGELWAGRGRFSQAVATLRSSNASDAQWRAMQYQVFDMPLHAGDFEARYAAMRTTLPDTTRPWVQVVAQQRVQSEAKLQQLLRDVVSGGGEGLVLHRAAALHAAGRSDDVRKLKPFDDAEARVVALEPGRGKYAHMTGALWVEWPAPEGAKIHFKLGTGFSDAQRRSPPAVGSWVTFRYRGTTNKGVPRFASLLRVAEEPGW
jgi:DNA ligase 1